MNDQLRHVGFWISNRRKGISQGKLAKKAGISQQALSKIESGENCTVETLLKILNALDVRIELPIKLIEEKISNPVESHPPGEREKQKNRIPENEPFGYF